MAKSPISYHTEYTFEKPFDRDQKKRSFHIIDKKRNPVNENSQLNKKYKMILKLQQKLHDKNKDNGENKL